MKTFSTVLHPYHSKVVLKITEKVRDGYEAYVTPDQPEVGDCVVYLRPAASAGTIAHEALHIVAHTMRHAGVKFGQSSEEAWTYLLAHVVDWLTSRLAAYTRASKKPGSIPA